MMKKALLVALCLVCLLLTGCGKNETAAVPTDALPAKAVAENTASFISDDTAPEVELHHGVFLYIQYDQRAG